MSTQDRDYPRSIYEANLDIDYAVCLHWMHETLYRRVRWAVVVIQLASVTAVLGPYLSEKAHPIIAAAGAFVLVAITILDAATDFAGKVYEHKEQRKELKRLRARTSKMSIDEIDAALDRLAADDNTFTLKSLRVPAYNENLSTHGRESFKVRPSWFERFMSIVA